MAGGGSDVLARCWLSRAIDARVAFMSDRRVALVTATSSGIGLEVALGLARRGVHVVATARDIARRGGLLAAAAQEGRLDDDYAPLLEAYLERTGRSFASAQPSKEAAAVVVEAALTEQPRFRWQTSPTAESFAGVSRTSSCR